MPRDISGSELDLLTSDHVQTYGRLIIDGTLVESVMGFDPLLSATWSADIDEPVQEATFRLDLGLGAETTSPLMSTGPTLGLGVGGPRPLFDVGRRIALQTASVPPGTLPELAGPWHTVFDGIIDDYDPASEPGGEESGDEGDVLTIPARDLMSAVLDDWVQDPLAVTGGLIADTVHELFDNYDFGFNPSLVGMTNIFLTVEGDPAFVILGYNQSPGSRLEIMRTIMLHNGFDLRGRFGTGIYGDDMFVLTGYDPDRLKSFVDWTMDPDKYYTVRTMKVSRNTVRNQVKARPNDAARVAQRVIDNPSVLMYGRRFMELSEEVWSHIDTPDEALALANYALSDLKEPKATMEVDLPYFWPIELNDVVRFDPNSIHHDAFLDLAVSGFTHTVSEDGDAATVIRTRGRPSAANSEWRYNPPKMQYVSDSDPTGEARNGALWLKRV